MKKNLKNLPCGVKVFVAPCVRPEHTLMIILRKSSPQYLGDGGATSLLNTPTKRAEAASNITTDVETMISSRKVSVCTNTNLSLSFGVWSSKKYQRIVLTCGKVF